MDFANGLSADHFDTETHLDLFPNELDFSNENAGLVSFLLPTMWKHGREEGFPLIGECPPPKRMKVEEVPPDFLLDVVMGDNFIDDWLMEGDVDSPSVEVDIDSFIHSLVSIVDSDAEGAEKENEAPAMGSFAHDSRIPRPSKKWMPPYLYESAAGTSLACAPSVGTTGTSMKKAKQAKKVLPVIAVHKVHVEERSLSTAQKAKHKLWVIKRKRCLTGFKGYRCPAKSLAARSKVRANGRFHGYVSDNDA